MKTRLNTILALLICAVLAFAAVFPLSVFAEGETGEYAWMDEALRAKLIAFCNQTDENGRTNGEKMLEYTHLYPDHFTPEEYDPEDSSTVENIWYSRFFLPLSQGCGIDLNPVLTFTCPVYETVPEEVHIDVDFSGGLDLSGTQLYSFSSFDKELTGINLDDCPKLGCLDVLLCEGVTLNAADAALTDVRILPSEADLNIRLKAADAPLRINRFGRGSVSFDYSSSRSSSYEIGQSTLTGRFLGWYSGGKPVGTDDVYIGSDAEGAELTAVFAGDVNYDDAVDTSDALAIMRSCLGLTGSIQAFLCDIDADDAVTSSDALAVLRFTLGLH